MELDRRGDGDKIQNVLYSKTGQKTVPNIFINGAHVGGNQELQAANRNGALDRALA